MTRVTSFSSKLILRAEQSFQLWKLWPGDGNLERRKDPIIGKKYSHLKSQMLKLFGMFKAQKGRPLVPT